MKNICFLINWVNVWWLTYSKNQVKAKHLVRNRLISLTDSSSSKDETGNENSKRCWILKPQLTEPLVYMVFCYLSSLPHLFPFVFQKFQDTNLFLRQCISALSLLSLSPCFLIFHLFPPLSSNYNTFFLIDANYHFFQRRSNLCVLY